MNIKFDFTETGGLPLDQGVLDDLQNGILQAEKISLILGPLVILSGCVVAGANAGNGVISINGEVLPFVGGPISTKVIIVQTTDNLTYFDGAARPSQITRYATFGDDGGAGNLWASFKRSTDGLLAEIDSLNDAVATLGAEIDALEASTVKKLASGSEALGDADPNHTDIGVGGTHTVSLGVTAPDTNYMVSFEVNSLSASPQDDLYHMVTIRNKTTTTFDVYFRETHASVQNIVFNWVAIAL